MSAQHLERDGGGVLSKLHLRIRPNPTVSICWQWCGAIVAMGSYLSSFFICVVAWDLET